MIRRFVNGRLGKADLLDVAWGKGYATALGRDVPTVKVTAQTKSIADSL